MTLGVQGKLEVMLSRGILVLVYLCAVADARDGRRRDVGGRWQKAEETPTQPYQPRRRPYQKQQLQQEPQQYGADAPFHQQMPPRNGEEAGMYGSYRDDGSAGHDHRFSNRGGVGIASGSDTAAYDDTGDVVPAYTKTVVAKSLVALSSAITSSVFAYLISKLVFSKASLVVSSLFGVVCSLSCFSRGDLSEFSKALGVFALLISRRTKPVNFIWQLLRNLRSLLMLSSRLPFPPTENPWKYSTSPRGAIGIPFSMMNVMIGVVITGFFTGWSVSKVVPFFPGWLGSIGCAVIFGYQCTLHDSKGDLFRYLGYAVNSLLSEVVTTVDDVMLREKTGILTGKLFAIVHRLDQNYQILTKIKLIVAGLIAQVTNLISSVQKDMEAGKQ